MSAVATLIEPNAAGTGPSGAVTVSTDVTAAEWDAYVATQPATGYHRWRWRDVFERGLGHPCRYFVARRGTDIVGVLPTVEVPGLFGRGVLSSLPYVNYGGVLASSQDAADALVAAASRVVAEERFAYLLLRHRQRKFSTLAVRSHKQTMMLPLKESAEAMWTALDRKVRNQVRKGEKSNLTVVTGGLELVDDFYAVFARNMRDLGTPVYGRELFAEMLRTFPDDIHIHAVRLGEQTIAVALTYAYGDVVEVPSASSLREHRSLCPNHLIYWEMLKFAIARGAKTFDFGRSTPGDGTCHFKEQWGAVAEPLEWEYALAAGQTLPTNDRTNSKFTLMIEAWKRLPLGVANALGPRIVKVVP